MQIESQNYVLEDPQFGNSGQLTPEETQTQQTVIQTPNQTPPSATYAQISLGVIAFVLIWWIVRRRSTRQ